MNKPQEHPAGKPGRRSRHPSPGIAPDYRVHQSDTDLRTDNLQSLIVVGAVIAGLVALAIGFPGRKRAKSIAVELVQTATQDAADTFQTELHETQILAHKPEVQTDPTLAAKLVELTSGERTALVYKVEKEKGQRPRITNRQRGRIVISDTANNIYLFAVSGHPEPIVFTIHDVRNMFTTLSGPCLAVGEA